MGVSVVIPTYNKHVLLSKAIDSILAQTYKEFEIIVSDDGSTDKTEEIINERYSNKVIYIKHKHGGQSYSRNLAIESSSFDIIAFLDHDDIWEHTYLEKTVGALSSKKEFIGVSTNRFDVYKDSRKSLKYKDNKPKNGIIGLKWMVKNGPILAPSTTVVYKKYLNMAGGFRNYFDGSEDWDLWLRMLRLGNFLYIDEPLVYKTEEGYDFSIPMDVWEKDVLILEDFLNHLKNKEKEMLDDEIQTISIKLYNRYAKALLHNESALRSRVYFKKSLKIKYSQPKVFFRYFLTFMPSPLSKALNGMYLRNVKRFYKKPEV